MDTIHTVTSDGGKAPTCTEPGSTERTYCSICGAVKNESGEIPATGHTEEVIPAKEATCTEPGLTEGKKCSTCGKILEPQEEADPALGHQMKSVTDKEATGGVDGSRHEECEVCGYKNAEEKISATGEHKYGAYKVTRNATALANGIKVRTCSVWESGICIYSKAESNNKTEYNFYHIKSETVNNKSNSQRTGKGRYGSLLEIQQHKDCNCKQYRKDHCPEENWFSSTDSDTEKWKESDS